MMKNSTNINKTINSHLNSLNINKIMTYGMGNPDPGLGQAQKYGSIKQVNGIPTHLKYSWMFLHCLL